MFLALFAVLKDGMRGSSPNGDCYLCARDKFSICKTGMQAPFGIHGPAARFQVDSYCNAMAAA
jgi:hypothetical protein